MRESARHYSPNVAVACKRAWARGLLVSYPGSRQLFIDIDGRDAWATFEFRMKRLLKMFVLQYTYTQSPSGRPYFRHVTVELDEDITEMERLFLQLYLGSDAMREILSYHALKDGVARPTVFFDTAEPLVIKKD